MTKVRVGLLTCALGLVPSLALAQQAVVTSPGSVYTTDASGTIGTSNTFQSVFPAAGNAAPRKGCLLVNVSTSRQWVYFGSLVNAATPSSVPMEPAGVVGALGGNVSCATGAGGTLQDQISISGTAGANYVAKQQ
jgi:hypothetical protein